MDDQLARLQQWVAARDVFGRDARIIDLKPLAGGQSSDLQRFVCRDADGVEKAYIVRREPRAKQLMQKPDVAREYAIMRGVEADGKVPVPPMIAVEPAEDVIGAPFFVMGEVSGFVPMGRPSLHLAGPLPGLEADFRARMWRSAMQALVDIHAIDWRTRQPFLLPQLAGEGALARHIDLLARWYEWTVQGRAYEVTDKALAYLIAERHRFDDEPPVLLWGDARVGNVMFRDDGGVAAVLDWEFATVGPAGMDLGHWMAMEEFQSEAIGVSRLPGWPTAAQTVSNYEEMAGRRIADIDYFVIMSSFFIAVTLIRQADLGVAAGRFPADTRMGHDNSTTQMIAQRLGIPSPELSPDFIKHRQLDRLVQGKLVHA